jgi:Ca2+-binding EF-hand superfamily protein
MSQPQLQQLWERLLKPSASDNGEGLTYRQFLHFLGVALDLTHQDDHKRGYTAFHSFLDLAPTK